MKLNAIDTEYKGYRFRSRLEARWAVFFDALHIKYEYEPEGFRVGEAKAYLPDFFLPELSTYVEIKPINSFEFSFDDEKNEFSMSGENVEKYAQACNCFAEAGYMYMLLCGDPIDVLLKNHGGNGSGWIFERLQCLIQASKELDIDIPWENTECNPEKCAACDHYAVMTALPFLGFGANSEFLVVLDNNGLFPTHWQHFMIVKPEKIDSDQKAMIGNNLQAAKKARQARFEFDEKG